jgi:hypothetical protein
MQPNYLVPTLRLAAGAALLSMVLAGCGKPPQPGEPTAPAPDAAPAAPAGEASPGGPGPANDVTAPGAAEPAPSPPPDAPPPTDPSPAAQPAAYEGPALDTMLAATPSAKLSVPVDLRYRFDAEPLTNQPVTLHLAAVSRVAGSNLHVSVKQTQGLQVASGPLEVQKATVAGVYRQQLSVTRSAAGPDKLRILVTMEMPEGMAFGYYSVPLTGGNAPQKLESVKQR